MNPILSIGVIATSLALTAVSITCEIALFTGFTQTELDQHLAAITGAGLVASQFLLVGVFQEHLHQKRRALATGLFLLIALLLGVSVAGTAAWLETRYQEQHQIALKSTQEHQLVTQLLEDFEQQASSLRKQAVLDRNTGNHWRAGERLKEAAQADEQRMKALAMLKNIKSVPQNSGQSLASENNTLRWGLWLILAALIDLCPLLGFASVRTPRSGSNETEPSKTSRVSMETLSASTTTTPTETEASKKNASPKLVTPKKVFANSATSKSNQTTFPNESNNRSTDSIKANAPTSIPAPVCCHNIADHQKLLNEEIKAGAYTSGLTIRALMKRHHVGFHKAKKILEGFQSSSKAKLVA